MSIYSNGGPEALAKALGDLPETVKAFPTDKGMADLCPNIRKLATAMRAGPPYNLPDSKPFLDKWTASSGQEHSDMLKDIESIEKACSEPTKVNIESMIRWQNAKESRTCSLHLNYYEQTFVQQSPDVWVHNGQPDGLCGAINIATLERHDGSLWNYRSRSVVTDKNAVKDNALFDCKKIDEREYLYVPGFEPKYAGCDYLKF